MFLYHQVHILYLPTVIHQLYAVIKAVNLLRIILNCKCVNIHIIHGHTTSRLTDTPCGSMAITSAFEGLRLGQHMSEI